MLKRLAILMALVPASSTAWADARSECADLKNTPADRSIATCSEVIRRDARAAWAYNNRGIAYKTKADYDRAIADYNTAIAIDPKHVSAYTNRGLAYYNKKDYDHAIADYNRAIEINPKFALAYNNRGLVYYKKKDYDRAVADYNRAIEINPKFALAYNNRGFVYYNKKDHDRAIADYKKAIEIDPKQALTYANLANVYKAQARDTDAEPLYDRSLAIRQQALAPEHRDVAQSLGSAEKGQASDDLIALRQQVRQLWSQGKYTEAIPVGERYVALARQRHGEQHAEFATAVAWLGVFYGAQGNYVEAEPLYKSALEIREKTLAPSHPDLAQSLHNLGWLYHEQGRYAGCLMPWGVRMRTWQTRFAGRWLHSTRHGGDCTRRVVRGGAWSSWAEDIRAAYREMAGQDDRFYSVGFRVARDLGN